MILKTKKLQQTAKCKHAPKPASIGWCGGLSEGAEESIHEGIGIGDLDQSRNGQTDVSPYHRHSQLADSSLPPSITAKTAINSDV